MAVDNFDEENLVLGAVGQTALDGGGGDDDGVAYPVNAAPGAGAGGAGAGAGAVRMAPAAAAGVVDPTFAIPAGTLRGFSPGERVLVFRQVLPPWEPLLPIPLADRAGGAAPAADDDDNDDDDDGDGAGALLGVRAASAASASASASAAAATAAGVEKGGGATPSSAAPDPIASSEFANPHAVPLLPKLYVPGPRPPRVPEFERRRGVVSAVQDPSQPDMVRVDVARENAVKCASDTVMIPVAALSTWQDYAVGSVVNVAPLAVLGRVVHADAQDGWLGVLVPMSAAEVASTASTRQGRCSEEDVALLRESVDPPAPPARGSAESAVPAWSGANAGVIGAPSPCLDGPSGPACYDVPSIAVSTNGKLFGRPCVPSTLVAGGKRTVIFMRIARALEWDFGAHNPKGLSVEISANPRLSIALRAFTVNPSLVPYCGQYPVVALRMHFALRIEPDIDTEFYDRYFAAAMGAGGKAAGGGTAPWHQNKKSSAFSSLGFGGGSGGGASGGGMSLTGGGDGSDGAGRAIWCILGFVFGICAILASCVAKQSKKRQSAAWFGCFANVALSVAIFVVFIVVFATAGIPAASAAQKAAVQQ